LNYEPL